MSKPNDLVQGTLDLLVLKMLALEPMNGWAIGQRLKQLSSEVLQVSDGSLYPALHKLEQAGWVTSEWRQSENNRRAKFYSLTRAGRKQLDVESGNWERLAQAISALVRLHDLPRQRHYLMLDRAWQSFTLRLRSLFRRREVERELEDELAYHVALETASRIRGGMEPAAARAAAVQSLGGLEFQKELVRDTRGTRGLEEWGRDVSVAVRSLRRAPAFTVAVVLTLALGIGANTAMFTLLHGALLRPLPHRDGDRIVYLRQSAVGAHDANTTFSVPEVGDYRRGARTLAAIAEYSSAVPFTFVASDSTPVRIRGGVISGNYFDVLGLGAALGRVFSARDDGAAAPPVCVLSYPFWLEHFGGDSSAIGRTVRLNGLVATIVGVAQRAPPYPRPTDVFLNTASSPHHLGASMTTERTHRMTELFARLTPGARVDQARREVTAIAEQAFARHPEAYEAAARFAVSLAPLQQALNERASLTIWLLMGAAVFVLLIACANVANLTLMRGVGREREMVVRATLGASRGRLRRSALVENLTLALVGGALGVLVAVGGLSLLVTFASQLSPRASEIRIDAVVLTVGLLTSVGVALALSFVPRLGGDDGLARALSAAGRRATLGAGRRHLQRALVVTQLAVSMILLTGAGLLVRTLTNVQLVESGVRTSRLLTLELPLDGTLDGFVTTQPQQLSHFERLRDRVAAVPGVELVSVGSIVPLRSSIVSFDVRGEGEAVAADAPTPHAVFKTVDAAYFAAAGIPLLRGRAVRPSDRRDAPKVVVLSASLARQLFGTRDPIGRRVAWTGEVLKFSPVSNEWRTVVGVVGDTRDDGLERAPTPAMYEPFAQDFIMGAALLVRTTSDPNVLQPAIIAAVRDVAPHQVIDEVATLADIHAESVAPRRSNALLIGAFALLALLVAVVGIAGVLAYSVRARTGEIGIRLSLGADSARVQRMVLREGGALLGAGLALGTAGAWVGGALVRGLLFGVSPHDPLTLGTALVALAAVGVGACWWPAARAARVEPAVALRAD